MKKVEIKGNPFVPHVDQNARPILKDVKKFLDSVYAKGSYHSNRIDVMQYGRVRIMGYSYNLRPFLKKYVYKDHYGNISESYAPNKTTLRGIAGTKLLYIIELKN